MKRITLALAALVAFVALPLLVSAAEEVKTIKGEPIDIQCYLGGKAGEAHAACAAACAKKGLPVGILTDDAGKKQVYLVMGDVGKDKLVELMGKKVEATGKVNSKDGIAVITITEVKPAA